MSTPSFGHLDSNGWTNPPRGSSCLICQKPDWCRVSKDGQWAACRRESRGAFKVRPDKNGADVYLHRLSDAGLGFPARGGYDPATSNGVHQHASRADAAKLDSAYRLLLELLPLSDSHADALLRRGLTTEMIVERGYRSWRRAGQVEIARRLHEHLGHDFATIPGFVLGAQGPRLACPYGLLIPCRNLDGLIVALKVRRDGATEQKYRYLSSAHSDGPGPGAPVHIPVGVQGPMDVVRLTEGELKADVATVLSGLATISVPGVANWRPGLDVLRALGAKTGRLSFDADAPPNRHVAKALLACGEALLAEGFLLELERWDGSIAKGIDDLLVAGHQPQLLAGEAALAAMKGLARDAGVATLPTLSGELAERLRTALDSGGAAALFSDKQLLGDLAKTAATNTAEWIPLREYAHTAGVKPRDLASALKPLIREARKAQPASTQEEEGETYFVSGSGCICRLKQTMDGPTSVPLANFSARICEQITHDDGVEARTMLAIEGQLQGGQPLPRVEITAEAFPRMNFPVDSWRARAVVYAGMSTRDHLRAAIQILSGDVPRRQVFAHTGWRCIDGNWCYLHGDGAIGGTGILEKSVVSLPDALEGYRLPEPPNGAALAEAVRASLGLINLAAPTITFPLVASVYRAVLGQADFALHVAGPTGVFKSEVAALAQQHFGAGLDARHLPGSWSSTGNALEGIAFAAKDALFVVDDFAPTGSTSDVQRLHREADRLLRGQGNNSGRQRMRSDGSLRATKPPRGLILSTGEEIPWGHSLRARLLVLEISPGDVDIRRLTDCQRDAGTGRYAQTLAGFLRWLAPQFEQVRDRLRVEAAALRGAAAAEGQHARAPGIVADLALGLRYFLAFATEVRAVSATEAKDLWNRGWASLCASTVAQAVHQQAAEPTQQFLRLLSGALASGRAHLASPTGDCPVGGAAFGWRCTTSGHGGQECETWRPVGHRIGWLDGEDLYLEPEASFAEVQRFAGEQGGSLSVAARTLHKRLEEKKHLVSTERGRNTLTVRRKLEGQRRPVLHLRRASICGDELTKLTNPTTTAESSEDSGQFAGQFEYPPAPNLTTETDQFAEELSPGGSLVSLVSSDEGIGAARAQSNLISASCDMEEGEL